MWEVKTEKWIMDIWYDQHQLSFSQDIVGQIEMIEFTVSLRSYCVTKESNSIANESKRHFNRSIIYYLNIVPIVNDSFWNSF